MSTMTYEPLRPAPPLLDQHVRIGWLLRVRRAARRAADAALAATRKAAGYVGRLVNAVQVGSPLSWARRAAGGVLRPAAAVSTRLGQSGIAATVTAILTSPTGQAVVKAAGRAVRKTGAWLASNAYNLLDQALRCFGAPGNKAADRLFSVLASNGGKLAELAAPVVHRVARLSDAQAPHVRLLSGLARSYVLHRTLRAFVGNPWLRLLVEAVLVPAVLDSRLVAWLRAAVQEVRIRAERLQEQADALTVLEVRLQRGSGGVPGDVPDGPVAADGLEDVLIPSNRAERRAAQRQERKHARQ